MKIQRRVNDSRGSPQDVLVSDEKQRESNSTGWKYAPESHTANAVIDKSLLVIIATNCCANDIVTCRFTMLTLQLRTRDLIANFGY